MWVLPLQQIREGTLHFRVAWVARSNVNSRLLNEGANPSVPIHFGHNAGRSDHSVVGIGSMFGFSFC
jgi:hypothetical protein